MSIRYRAVARVTKTHGRKGEVVTVPVHGLPFVLREGLRVVIVPPRLKGPRERTVLSCESSDAGQLVRLSGIDDLGAASELVGRTLLCSEHDLPNGFALKDVPRLLGRPVCDAREGDLGTISEVMRGPANDVWVVDGPYGEVLLPVVEAYVTSLPKAGRILVDLPAGLVSHEGAPGGDQG